MTARADVCSGHPGIVPDSTHQPGDPDMRYRLALSLLALPLLCACSKPGWQRADTTPAQLVQDEQECRAWVAEAFPAKPTEGKPLAYETDCATYGHQSSCATGPGPVMATPSRMTQKKTALQNCMRSRGYTRP